LKRKRGGRMFFYVMGKGDDLEPEPPRAKRGEKGECRCRGVAQGWKGEYLDEEGGGESIPPFIGEGRGH